MSRSFDRLFVLSILVVPLAAGCTRGAGPVPTGPAPNATRTPSRSASGGGLTTAPSPSPKFTPTDLVLPSDAPTTFGEPLDPAAVPPGELLPPGALVTSSWTTGPPDDPLALVGLAWSRGKDPLEQEHGFVLWERFDGREPPWRVVEAFTDPPSRHVFGVRLETSDLTGDGIDDALTFEDIGGSGACGTWRVISPVTGSASQIFRRRTCDTQITIAGGSLRIRKAVFLPGDAHCCPSSFDITVLRWDGTSWRQIEHTTTPAPT